MRREAGERGCAHRLRVRVFQPLAAVLIG